MDERNCTQCGAGLTGRQTRYCSPTCAQRGFSAARIADGRFREYRRRDDVKARNRERQRVAAQEERYTQTFTCERCGSEHTNRRGEQARFCSHACAKPKRVRKPKVPWEPPDMRSPLRVAWEAEDWRTVERELQTRTAKHPSGCLVWTGPVGTDGGYPLVKIGQRRHPAHRVMAIATNLGPIGPSPVHHKCANRRCINPEHLQVVTAAENTAEMLQRRWYENRIAVLEAALASVAPDHPLLTQLPIHLAVG